MICFSGKCDESVKRLRRTLERLGAVVEIMVFEDDGFLPKGISSPYEYYVSKQNCEKYVEKELHYDSLHLPEGWNAWPDGMTNGERHMGIYHMGHERAAIYFREMQSNYVENLAEAPEKKIVQRVEWYTEGGWSYRVDFYNKYGLKYASEFRGIGGTVELKVYYSDRNREVIVEYPENDVVTLLENGAVKAFFNSRKEFIEHFVSEITADEKMALFIQDHEMLESLDIRPDAEQAWGFAWCTDDELLFQYENLGGKNGFRFFEIPEHYPVNGAKSDALILTRYDKIENIEELTQELPEVTFHIGANTLMSDKLMNLEKPGNVKLYPGLSQDVLDELWEKCDFYLDINLYGEIRDAVNVAQQKNLLVMGFENTVHHKELTVKECVYPAQEYKKMAFDIGHMLQKPEWMQELLAAQQRNRKDFYQEISIPTIMDCKFTLTVLKESYGDNLALSWIFEGSATGFLVYDKTGNLIYETRNIHQHYYCIEGYAKEDSFVVKAYVETLKGKMVVAESEAIAVEAKPYGTPRVSLVMAAYNAEDYIVRSIDTALAQSFLDLELIIVDDGSTDSTPDIIDWYTNKYSNILAIHKENGGVATARNVGIERANGEYIGFLDNDDMIRPEMVIKLHDSVKKNECDIAMSSVCQIVNGVSQKFIQYPMEEDVAMTMDEFFNMHFTKGCMFSVVIWNKLYKASLVKQHLLPELIADDDAWTPYILSYADKICYLNGCFYEWDRTIRSNTQVDEWNRKSREETFLIHKNATMFYLENGNPKRLDFLKKLANRQLLEMRKAFGDDEYEKLWEKIEKEF